MKKSLLLSLILSCVALCGVMGQKLDLSFHSPLPIRAAYIRAVQVQPDGKILIGGDIKFYGTQRVHNLIRIHPDGSLDDSFVFASADDHSVTNLFLMESGEMIASIMGYDSYNDHSKPFRKIIKIAADGEVILELPEKGPVLAVDSEGRLFINGPTLMRYHDDFTPDTDFNANISTAGGGVNAVAFSDYKIVIAGAFTHVNGVAKNDVARLHADGTLDNTFDVGSGTEDFIGALTVQPDGKILPGECFINSFNGHPASGMIRLNTDGSIDHSFTPPKLNGGVSKPVVTEDGIYAAAFLQHGMETSDRLFRLNVHDGTLDPDFPPVQLDVFGASSLRTGLAGQDVIVNCTQKNGNVYGLSKVLRDGSYDEAFLPPVSRYGTIRHADFFRGKLLVAGDFIRIDGIETYGIARLFLDGEVDASFRLRQNKGVVQQLKVLDGDNVLVTTYKHFFKLDADGNERPDFLWSPFKTLYQVVKFKVLGNQKIMVGDPNLLYRLQADGSEDPSFSIGDLCCMVSTAFDFDIQGTNVIYGSVFSELGGVPANRLARLTDAGEVDPTFDIGAGPDGTVRLVKVLNNNEVLVGGHFENFDGNAVSFPLVKLSADGKTDKEFLENIQSNPALPYGVLWSRKVEQLGSTVYFQDNDGVYAINIDGTVDSDFNIPAAVSAVSDIITFTDNSEEGRQASEDAYLISVGHFSVNSLDAPSFILKMEVDVAPLPSEVTTSTTLSAHEGGAFGIQIFPHPVADKFSINLDGPDGYYSATVFDLSGKKYLEQEIDILHQGTTPEVNLQRAPPGMYLLKLSPSKGRASFLKFVKHHD